jgi:putative heme transporter
VGAAGTASLVTADKTVTRTGPVRVGHRLRTVAKIVGVAAVVLGAGFAVYRERITLGQGLGVLGSRTELGWVIACVDAQCLSMMFFALLQQRLLNAAGVRLTARWLLSTAHLANALAVSVPVIGSGMATTYAYQRLREQSVDSVVAKAALALAGVVSTVTFTVLVAIAALVSGSPAAALSAAAGVLIGLAALGVAVVGLRSPARRAALQRHTIRLLSTVQRVVRRPRGDPGRLIDSVVEQLRLFRLGPATIGLALTWGMLNWTADACCLILAIKAIGVHVPWGGVLLAWSAGQGAASFSPTPGGIGVVEVAITAALVAAGLRPADALAAVLLYRIVSFKFIPSLAWFGGRIATRRHGERTEVTEPEDGTTSA